MTARTKLHDRALPDYTRGEEIFNTVSHIAGGVFAVAALVACVAVAAMRHSAWNIVGGTAFGVTMILLYAASSIYHGLVTELPKKVFQVIDHCAIFVFIAGTYTAVGLGRFREQYPVIAWSMLGFVWGVAALCVSLNAVDLKKFKVFSMVCYIALGWSVAVFAKQLYLSIPHSALALVLAGGIAYTVGSVLYMLGKRSARKYIHSVYHLFVLAGSALHFAGVLICFLQ